MVFTVQFGSGHHYKDRQWSSLYGLTAVITVRMDSGHHCKDGQWSSLYSLTVVIIVWLDSRGIPMLSTSLAKMLSIPELPSAWA